MTDMRNEKILLTREEIPVIRKFLEDMGEPIFLGGVIGRPDTFEDGKGRLLEYDPYTSPANWLSYVRDRYKSEGVMTVRQFMGKYGRYQLSSIYD